MLERRRASVPVFAALLLSVSALSASAAPDHLVCRRTRETGPGAIRSADVVSAAYAGTGCIVRTPAKIICEQATVSNVNPPAANAQFHGRGNPGRFLCYRLKCPKELDTVTLNDTLGTHVTNAGASHLLCVPEVASGLTSCDTPAGDCQSCAGGCATHQEPSPPGVCIDANACYSLPVDCASDAACQAGYACVVAPFNPLATACCPACAP